MLEARDNQLRLDFANKFLIRYDEDSSWPLCILWTDEAHFTLTGNLNSKNCVYWANSNPHDVIASHLNDEKVTAWCGITSTFIFGHYWFEEVTNGNLKRCTVSTACYLDMLTHYAIPQLQQQNTLSEVMWMQDGTPPHVGSLVKHLLSQQFGDRVISRRFLFP